MEREIKFRGLRVDTREWVYGGLVSVYNGETGSRHPEIVISYNVDTFDWIEVIPESVGQYTGLKDKNGNEIYEGDIIKIPDDWDSFGFMAGEVRSIYFFDGCFRFKPKDETKQRGHTLEYVSNEFEIIGNIHEPTPHNLT